MLELWFGELFGSSGSRCMLDAAGRAEQAGRQEKRHVPRQRRVITGLWAFTAGGQRNQGHANREPPRKQQAGRARAVDRDASWPLMRTSVFNSAAAERRMGVDTALGNCGQRRPVGVRVTTDRGEYDEAACHARPDSVRTAQPDTRAVNDSFNIFRRTNM